MITRADGTPKRGRGRGSRGGATGTRRGGGPGSRGGRVPGEGRGGTRKPRITKADKARMDQEKADRERLATSTTLPFPSPLTAATPMVLG